MTRDEFIDNILDEVTIGGELQISFKPERIIKIIEREKKVLAEIYPYILETKHLLVDPGTFSNPSFAENRTLKFPKCVYAIMRVEECTGRMPFWSVGNNFGNIGLTGMYAQFGLGGFYSGLACTGMDNVLARLIDMSSIEMLKSMSLVNIQYDFNHNTGNMYFKGHTPRYPLYIELAQIIDDNDFFEDPWVYKWICAKVLREVARQLETFQVNLIGGVSINASVYKDTAQAYEEECKDTFKKMNTGDWFVTT